MNTLRTKEPGPPQRPIYLAVPPPLLLFSNRTCLYTPYWPHPSLPPEAKPCRRLRSRVPYASRLMGERCIEPLCLPLLACGAAAAGLATIVAIWFLMEVPDQCTRIWLLLSLPAFAAGLAGGLAMGAAARIDHRLLAGALGITLAALVCALVKWDASVIFAAILFGQISLFPLLLGAALAHLLWTGPRRHRRHRQRARRLNTRRGHAH
jgi:hypothetical protein